MRSPNHEDPGDLRGGGVPLVGERVWFVLARTVLWLLAGSFFAGSAAAQSSAFFGDWGSTDTFLLATMLTSTAIDWGQTRYIARNPDRFYERNPILGRHPSVNRVDRYFALCGLAAGGLTAVLSKDNRRRFLLGVTIVETAFVIQNHHLGVRVAF
jgi:hypothetical protein